MTFYKRISRLIAYDTHRRDLFVTDDHAVFRFGSLFTSQTKTVYHFLYSNVNL